LTLLAEPAVSFRLQAATNMSTANWIDVVSFTNTQSTISLTDTTATMFPQRFYRVVSP